MKVVPVLLAVCVASASAKVLSGYVDDDPVVGQAADAPYLRRSLQNSGSITTDAPAAPPVASLVTPPTNAPATTPQPPAPAPVPATPAPAPVTPAPAPPPPTTSAPANPAPASPAPSPPAPSPPAPQTPPSQTPRSTPAPSPAPTDAPVKTPDVPTTATTPAPAPTTATSTTATPTATEIPTEKPANTSKDTPSSTPNDTPTAASTSGITPTPTESATTPNAGSGSNLSPSPSSNKSTTSSLSSGAVIGIVVGIVAVVVIFAAIIMGIIRRRRETDDDPLSPFELSMDKGYNPTHSAFATPNQQIPRATATSASNSSLVNGKASAAGAVAAGVAYAPFYDVAATSPGSMNQSSMHSVMMDRDTKLTNDTNLWLSAMEPKENETYLSANESPRSRGSSVNSYDMSARQVADADQSSEISGGSLKGSDEFPDHTEERDSRESYEL